MTTTNPQAGISVVTLSGECFKFVYKDQVPDLKRDGIIYQCHVTDLARDRGKRLVSVFISNWHAEFPEYKDRIDILRLNRIRSAFDSGELTFDEPYSPVYKVLLLDEPWFQKSQRKATETQIRQFIKNAAYWLGFRGPHLDKYFVRFDLEQDLEYLGVTLDSVRRSVWRLEQEGYLEKSEIPGNGIATLKLIDEFEATEHSIDEAERTRDTERMAKQNRSVFVVHGHDDAMKESVARFLEKLDLNPIILHEQANKGRTIIEKFEDHSTEVGFAIVLLSPDDFGGARGEEAKPRARQNVILELGYFIGTLGRARVCALHAGGVELPSDLHGLLWLSYEGDWKLKLAREIKEAEIDIDLNQAY